MVDTIEHAPIIVTQSQLYGSNGLSLNMPRVLGENDPGVINSSRQLRLGSFDHLQLIADNDGGRYKRLDNFVRFQWGPRNTTVYIFDHHQFALFGWAEAMMEGKIEPGASLRHWDDHDDASIANRLEVMTKEIFLQRQWDLQQFVRYTQAIGCGSFIEPAQRMGLVDEFIHIAPGHELTIDHIPTDPAGRTSHTRMSARYYRNNRRPVSDPKQTIVDIDLDYFVSKNLRGMDIAIDIDTIRTDMSSAGVVTIATSPGFIQQEQALEFARRILA